MDDQAVRVSKLLAERGVCSRREADALLAAGLVSVDGVAVGLGAKALPSQAIAVAPAGDRALAQRATVLLHKPIGYVSGQAEDGYTPAVALIRPENRAASDATPATWSPRLLEGLAPAGRLDIDSTGLLVLTQNGTIARRLVGADTDIGKEYLVRVHGTLTDANLALLNHGLSLDGKLLRPAEVAWQNADQLRFVLREGRKRQIRRMCERVGLRVLALKRVRIGRVVLGNLALGQWRFLGEGEAF